MIRIKAFSLFARRYSLYQKGRPGVSRLASCFSSSTTTRDQHGVKSFDEIPGPGTFINIVNFIRKGGVKNLYQIQCEKFEKFGPIFKEEMFGKQTVHIADAEANAVIARTEGIFPTREFLDLQEITETQMYDFLGNDHERWKAARRPIAPSLLRPIEIQKFAPGISSVSKDAVKRFRRELKDGRMAHLKDELNGFATENVLLLIFGERMGYYDDPQNPKMIEFIHTAYDFNDAMVSLGMSPPLLRYVKTRTFKKLRQAKQKLYNLATEFAKVRNTQVDCDEYISLFDQIPGEQNRADIAKHLAIALSQAGVETTGGTLAWCLYHLSRNPEAQEKAYQEIVSVIGTATNDKSSEIPQFHSKLPYLKACIKEAMRLNPTVNLLQRKIEKDTTVCGYTIAANSSVTMWFSYASLSAKNFSKPEEFNPQRWIRAERLEKIHPYAAIPFGFGVRMCLGRRFAEMEMIIGVAHLLQSFRLEYVGDDKVKSIMKAVLSIPGKEPPIKFIERV